MNCVDVRQKNFIRNIGNSSSRNGWVYPTRISEITDAFNWELPSVDAIVANHTRFRLYAPFLSEQQANSLYEHHVAYGTRRGGLCLGSTQSINRGRLAFCIECVQEDYERYGYPIWRRAHLTPGMWVCSVHAKELVTFCHACESGHRRTKRTWLPAVRCVCGGSLKPIVMLDRATKHIALMVATMADDLLQGRVPVVLSNESIAAAIRWECGRLSKTQACGNLSDALFSKLGDAGASLFGITNWTLGRFVGRECREGFVRNPIQNLAIIAIVFDSWNRLEEAQLAASLTSALTCPVPAEPQKRKRSRNRNLKGEMYASYVESLPGASPKNLTFKYRDWLLANLHERPSLTRSEIEDLPGGFRAMIHFRAVDEAWLDGVLPRRKKSKVLNVSKGSIDGRVFSLVNHIKEQHFKIISVQPERRIYRASLLNNSRCESKRMKIHEELPVVDALNLCVDTDESWRQRVVPIVCGKVRRRCLLNHFGDENSYAILGHAEAVKRIQKARKWIKSFDLSLETAVTSPFREQGQNR